MMSVQYTTVCEYSLRSIGASMQRKTAEAASVLEGPRLLTTPDSCLSSVHDWDKTRLAVCCADLSDQAIRRNRKQAHMRDLSDLWARTCFGRWLVVKFSVILN
eukprot:6209122-Pleurochrysis_carterae.AAC.6